MEPPNSGVIFVSAEPKEKEERSNHENSLSNPRKHRP